MLTTTKYWDAGVQEAYRLFGAVKIANPLRPPDLSDNAFHGPYPDDLPAGAKGSLRARLKNWRPSGRVAAGAGLLAGGALMASQLGGQPTMTVTPSAPIAPMYP